MSARASGPNGDQPVTAPPPVSAEPRIDSVELFRGRPRIVIVHRGTEYRLQITRAGKLILTK